jgi:TRAP-type C4-dicarboxylate transport system permease large subunit
MQYTNDYIVHLVLVVTFLAGAITSRLKEHLTLAIKVPIKEPLYMIIRTGVQILCAALTVAFAWSSLAFADIGFTPSDRIGIFPKRLLLLVMAAGYLAMAVRFIMALEQKKRRGVWLILAAVLGSFIAFSSIVQVFTGAAAMPPALLAFWQTPFQALLNTAALPLIGLLIVSAFFGTPIFVVLGGSAYLLFAHFIMLVAGLLLLLAVTASISLTLVESAAVAAVYILFIQVVIRHDLKIRDLPLVMRKCLPIIGGVLIILSLANGLSFYLIDADIPMKLTAWVQNSIGSKYVFLFLLNIALLITGCFMDIFSAILVVVPLIIPLGNLFGIHPVHLGIIFLANMELGYLTPPVGLNLFLASYRFNEPMTRVAKNTFKFLLIQLVMVLLITYIPLLTTLLLTK